MSKKKGKRNNSVVKTLLALILGLSLLPAGYVQVKAETEVLPVAINDTFDDGTGNENLTGWTFGTGTLPTVTGKPADGSDTVPDPNSKCLSFAGIAANKKAYKAFTPLAGKVVISLQFRVENSIAGNTSNHQLKLPEIQGNIIKSDGTSGSAVFTSITAVQSSTPDAFDIQITTGDSTVKKVGLSTKTWLSAKMEFDTESDRFSVWIGSEKIVDNATVYQKNNIKNINLIQFYPKLTGLPNFYVDNYKVEGNATQADVKPDVRNIVLNPSPTVPLAPQIVKKHPRIFLDDFEEVKRKISSDYIPMKWYDGVKKQADILLDTPVRSYKVGNGNDPDSGQILEHAREMENRTFILSLAYQMERERKYLDRLWLEIQNTASYPTWMPESFLSVAEMCQAYAVAYDWNYYDWSDVQRKFIIDTLLDKGLTYGVDRYNGISQGGTSFTSVTHNWNVVCNGGLMIGALAVADDYPNVTEFILEKGSENIKKGLTAYAPLGAYPEGSMYWAYGTNYLTYTMAALETAFPKEFFMETMPSKYRLYEAPGIAETPDFTIYMMGKTGTFNYGDSSMGRQYSPLMMWFASKFDKPQYAWSFLQAKAQDELLGIDAAVGRGTVYSILWYDSNYASLTGAFPLDKVYQTSTQDTNSVLLRSSWQDVNGIYAGMKGGYNRENHSSLAIGTFVLEALGERWATMRGAGNYDWPSYNDLTGGRFQYYGNRAEGQNTLVLNPDGGFDQRIEATGHVVGFQSNAQEAFGIMDMTEAYQEDASTVKRGLRLFDNRSRIRLQDEIQAASDLDAWWFMHTNAEVQFIPDRKSALLTQNGKRMWVHIVEGPEDAKFSAMDAKPFPQSPNPEVQNSTYGTKLAIHMQNSKDIRLVVDFVPLKDGEANPTKYDSVRSLAEWTLTPGELPSLGEKIADNVAFLNNSSLIYSNGEKDYIDTQNPGVTPVSEGDKTMIPVADAAYGLGAITEYDAGADIDIIQREGRVILLPREQQQKSADASLSSLFVEPGGIQFSSEILSYSLQVDNSVSSVEVKPTATDTKHRGITINGAAHPSGTVYTLPLAVGVNSANITVTAEDGKQRTYVLEITRIAASPAGNPQPGGITTPVENTYRVTTAGLEIQPKLKDGSTTAEVQIQKEVFKKTVEQAKPEQEKINIQIQSVAGAKGYSMVLPAGTLSGMENKRIRVATELGVLEIPVKELDAEKELMLVIEKTEQGNWSTATREVVGSRPAIRTKILENGAPKLKGDPESTVKLSIPYLPFPSEKANTEHLVVVRLDEKGNSIPVTNGRYNAVEGTVDFQTRRLEEGTFAVAYIVKTFDDTTSYPWAEKEISVLASKGIIQGTSATNFVPQSDVTRGDFLLLLMKALDMEASVDSNFDDVSTSDYYYQAIGVAKKLGISTGTGDNLFRPHETISREDMMTLAARAMRIAKKLGSTSAETSNELERFEDRAQVQTYAAESVSTLIKEGIIKGDGARINPSDNTSRAEVAVILYRIYNR